MPIFNCFEYEHIYQQIKEQICTRKESNDLKGTILSVGEPTI
jgi:hypothetical protein